MTWKVGGSFHFGSSVCLITSVLPSDGPVTHVRYTVEGKDWHRLITVQRAEREERKWMISQGAAEEWLDAWG